MIEIFKNNFLTSFLSNDFFKVFWQIIAFLLYIVAVFSLFIYWLVNLLGNIDV